MDSIKNIKRWCEQVKGQWNGDELGIEEDNALLADEILDTIDDLMDLITELKESATL